MDGPTLVGCAELVLHDGRPIALCPGPAGTTYAHRIAQLIDRHGLADIPDTPAQLATIWPAPNPHDRRHHP